MATWSKAIRQVKWWNVARNTLYLYSTTYVITRHFGELIICKGQSMWPNLLNNDIVIGEKLSVRRGDIKPGDVVCVTDPFNHRSLFCKRVAHGPLEEIDYEQRYEFPLFRVPPGHLFLIGDNEQVSNDSRNFGPVPLGMLQVRLFFRIWPLNKIGYVN